MAKSVHVTVTGKVQGVWYRAWVLGAAQKLGLYGWVRNLRNGDVEAVFCGSEQLVDQMLEQCWQGSPHCDVKNITSKPAEIIKDERFVVARTS